MFRYAVALYIFLSLSDLFGTIALIELCDLNIEGNPLASMVYGRFGSSGMVVLKLSTILVAVSIARYVNSKKFFFYSYLIILLGCLVYFVTIGYTATLVAAIILDLL